MKHFWIRTTTRLQDRLRYSRSLRLFAMWLSALRGFLCVRTALRLNHWAESHRMAMGLESYSPASKALTPWILDQEKSQIWRTERIGWSRYGVTGVGGSLRKSIILRYPEDDTKGILFVWFEYDLLTLLSTDDLPSLLDRYRVVFLGSWSPPCYQAIWSFPIEFRNELLLGLSHPNDDERLRSLGYTAQLLPLYMSHWMDPDDFNPSPRTERDVDIVMVANWAKFKRHWVLFEALSQINVGALKVVLIGQPESGRTVDHVRAEARAYGVANQITFLDRQPVTEVWRWLERSKVSLIFSKREGSCVVVAESLMANTPVGLLHDAEIGSRSFINESTGRFLGASGSVALDLKRFLEDCDRMNAREWAEENISLSASKQTLQNNLSLKHGENRKAIPSLLPFSLRGALKPEYNANEYREELRLLREHHNLHFPLHE